MYFCPCSCTKAEGENEEDVLICLPRNLSYAGESYLDRYSVSSAFVHNAKLEKQMLQADFERQYLTSEVAACSERDLRIEQEGLEEKQDRDNQGSLSGVPAMADPGTCSAEESSPAAFRGGPDSCDVSVEATMSDSTSHSVSNPVTTCTPFCPPLSVSIRCGVNPKNQSDFSRYVVNIVESPDSDVVSEEGIFVNMMDDLDGVEGTNGKSTLSEASDDTYVSGDSMYYSPQEVEEMDTEVDDLRVSLEEAVQQAAHDLPQPTDDCAQLESEDGSTHVCETDIAKETDSSKTEENIDSNSEDTKLELENIGECQTEDTNRSTTTKPVSSVSDCKPQGVNSFRSENSSLQSKQDVALKITINDRPFRPDDRGPLSSSYRDLVSPESPLYEDREFNFTKSELRKSTSLKSTKTPPGTPRRKKVVRFADAMGLDLESVRHILNLESPPKIPPSAMKDLQVGLGEDRKEIGTKFIVETFPQPGADIKFREKVLSQKVALENALVVSGAITGVIRVANIAFHKTARVRFTSNGWASFHDIAASYMLNSNDGATDRFSFTIVPPADFMPGSKLEFAISYSANGTDYWDSNNGNNYCFECFAKTTPTETESAWMHFL